MEALERLIQSFGSMARMRIVAEVTHNQKTYPLYCVSLGSEDPSHPVLGVFGGVHGLEKIGAEVALSFMQTVQELVRWDKAYLSRFESSRLVFMPIINPVGIVNRTRSNGNGVDLMRNSPLDGEEKESPIYSGHRITPRLPWFRGIEGAEMEVEAKAMIDVVEKEILPSSLSICVDVHSGFGARDRLWFPYSHSRKPFPGLAETYGLKKLFDRTYSHHFYQFEPVSRQYTINGDMWDYMYEEHRKKTGEQGGFFLPLTLEMGSWNWLRKNPTQIFYRFGFFDPVKPHRRHRILRRHLSLFDFLHRAVLSSTAWRPKDLEERSEFEKKGMDLWYGDNG